jgi:tetrahydromethanopterin S-methyltransferase subunit G
MKLSDEQKRVIKGLDNLDLFNYIENLMTEAVEIEGQRVIGKITDVLYPFIGCVENPNSIEDISRVEVEKRLEEVKDVIDKMFDEYQKRGVI